MNVGSTFSLRPESVSRSLYVTQGLARAFVLRVQSNTVMRRVLRRPHVEPSSEERKELRRLIAALYETDWKNVREGLYPESLLGFSWRRFAATMPHMASDLPGMYRRMSKNIFDDVPVEAEHLPAYYRRNFHFQNKGWLSTQSARVYDAQVEMLFMGTADAMRRQVLPPVVKALKGSALEGRRILDVACGTGSVLAMFAQALPGASLYGVDLSPHYLALARQRLGASVPVSLVAEAAEAMPFSDGFFDAAVNVYLMHELPSDVRSKVFQEIARVLKPGATFVLADSEQASHAPALAPFLDNFPKQFHEPYFKSYQRDDLEARMRDAGFEVLERKQHFLTTVITARRL